MTLREAIWETVLILPPSPTLGGEFGAGGGGSSCPLSLRNRWGRAEELQGWGPHSPPSPPSAIFFPPVWHIGIHLSWKYRRPPGRPLAISHSLQLLITPPCITVGYLGSSTKKGSAERWDFNPARPLKWVNPGARI